MFDMMMSPAGRQILMQREGVRLTAYQDERDIWTIGVGHTAFAGPPTPVAGMTITLQECDQIFARDLAQFEQAVNQAIVVPIPQNAFDACVSLCYNIGPKGFTGSTVVHKINLGDMEGAADAFLMWDRPPSLLSRRKSERAQFLGP
jgi:lysozyme